MRWIGEFEEPETEFSIQLLAAEPTAWGHVVKAFSAMRRAKRSGGKGVA
jgi:hypothetical protein